MKTIATILVFSAGAAAASACNNPAVNHNCTDQYVPGLIVTVLDSTTGTAAGKDSHIVASNGTVTDSTPLPPTGVSDGPFGVAYETRGTWTLTVRKAGYRNWTRSGIVVPGDQCHVHTVNVTAKLQP